MSKHNHFESNGVEIILKVVSIVFLIVGGSVGGVVFAQESGKPMWVTDEFEITMRSGKDNRKAIVRMLSSGTKLDSLEKDSDTGYTRVRTRSGAEGWVLSRYLLRNPPARVSMPGVQAQLATSDEQRKKLARDLRELTVEHAALKKQLGQSENSGEDLQRELSRISELSSNTVQIDSDNRRLKQVLAETQKLLEDEQGKNAKLASRSNREWFVIGALVVMFGIVVGLILPRIRWRKKSSWGEL